MSPRLRKTLNYAPKKTQEHNMERAKMSPIASRRMLPMGWIKCQTMHKDAVSQRTEVKGRESWKREGTASTHGKLTKGFVRMCVLVTHPSKTGKRHNRRTSKHACGLVRCMQRLEKRCVTMSQIRPKPAGRNVPDGGEKWGVVGEVLRGSLVR